MSHDTAGGCFLATLLGSLVAAVLVLFWLKGWYAGERSTRQAAVDAGAGEWTVDAQGFRGFRFLTPANDQAAR